jgi:trimethylamine:corrinoid methyltransferase-like protein
LKIDDERLGVDLIDKVMEGSRNFLAEKHTLKFLREGEVIHPNLASRDSWTQWEKTSRSSIVDRAEEKANFLIDVSPSQPLEDRHLKEFTKEFTKVIQAYKKTKR